MLAYHFLSIVCVGETNTDGLVYEEDVGMLVPRLFKALGGVRTSDPARS